MSNVIMFLESLGSNAQLGRLGGDAYTAAVDALGLDGASRQALLDRDEVALSRLLGGRSNVLSLLVPAEDDDKQDDDGEEKQDEDRETQVRAA